MFELPQAKRVRREYVSNSRRPSPSPSSSSPKSDDPDPTRQTSHDAPYKIEHEYINIPTASSPMNETQITNKPASHPPAAQEEDDEEAHPFHLFRPAPTCTPKVPLIHLNPFPTSTVKPYKNQRARHRPPSYYFASPPSPPRALQLAHSAVSAEDVRKAAARPWPGCRYPWRVVVFPAGADRTCAGRWAGDECGECEVKRRECRKGKKTRIKIRTRLRADARAREERDEVKRREEEKVREKEAYLREKKSRLNRRRQIKRREKEREKKRCGGGATRETGNGEDLTWKEVNAMENKV